MKRLPTGRPILSVLITGAVLAAGFAIGNRVTTALAVSNAFTGTTLCVRDAGPVMSPKAGQSCQTNTTPVTVANLDSVRNLAASVQALQNQETTPMGQTSTYTVPDGVNDLKVELWGGGGGGGGGGLPEVGGSGAQGDYTHAVLTVTPGETCSVVVGQGGPGGAAGYIGKAQPGGDSSISCGATTVAAGGGAPGEGNSAPGVNAAPPAPSASFQTFVGLSGQEGALICGPTTRGGGTGFPGAGGDGGNCTFDSTSGHTATAGADGSAGLALITPAG